MANLKSSQKDIRRIFKRTKANAAQKSKVRTFLKNAKKAVLESQTYKEGMTAVVLYEKHAMIAIKNNLFSKSAVARNTSTLVQKLKSRFNQDEQIA